LNACFAISEKSAVIEKMRRFLTKLVVAVMIFGTMMSILWLFAGRQLSMFIDRCQTIEIVSSPLESISIDHISRDGFSIEGHGTGGVLVVGEPHKPTDLTAREYLRLELIMPTGKSPLLVMTENGDAALSFAGKVFILSPLLAGGTEEMVEWIGIGRPPGDEASFSIRHSAISWMESFNFNNPPGKSPSWKRHLYHQLIWKKANDGRLKMLWRNEQPYLDKDGWRNETEPGQVLTGLIRVDIQN
jgi:hypothetical protein